MSFPSDFLGITATIPAEVPLAAGRRLIDLNNLFITAAEAGDAIKLAEKDGFPRNCCAWIKGIYGMVKLRNLRRMVFVTGGDCSNTHALMETLMPHLEEIHTFSYPYPRDAEALRLELERFCHGFGLTLDQAEAQRNHLAAIRQDLAQLDRLNWQDRLCSGQETFQRLVASSDFDGDTERFHHGLRTFLDEVACRKPLSAKSRIGILGVPAAFSDLIETVEALDATVVFNEIPRQFAMPEPTANLVEQYSRYTYPYGVWARLDDVKKQVKLRNIHGIIHYTQSFCHRQIHDILIRKEIPLPILTIEGENPGLIDQRTRLRIESFMEIMQRQTSGDRTP
jgi:benzoyl-CoA reductase/2-hydroxyglutaryl-CoA dehydratase subunit BcrC/BadD/HgdB